MGWRHESVTPLSAPQEYASDTEQGGASVTTMWQRHTMSSQAIPSDAIATSKDALPNEDLSVSVSRPTSAWNKRGPIKRNVYKVDTDQDIVAITSSISTSKRQADRDLAHHLAHDVPHGDVGASDLQMRS